MQTHAQSHMTLFKRQPPWYDVFFAETRPGSKYIFTSMSTLVMTEYKYIAKSSVRVRVHLNKYEYISYDIRCSKLLVIAEEEVGGQHQRVDRPGLLRETKSGRRQEEVETPGFKVIGGAPTSLQVMGLMMMMIFLK